MIFLVLSALGGIEFCNIKCERTKSIEDVTLLSYLAKCEMHVCKVNTSFFK